MVPIHHSILCQTQGEYDAALAILRIPIVTSGPKCGILRRPRNQTIILAWHISHFAGYGERKERHVLWFAERSEADTEIWRHISIALDQLKLGSTIDSSEAWRFLGRI